MKFFVKYEGRKDGKKFVEKVLRTSEIVTQLKTEESSFYVTAYKDEKDTKSFYELSLFKANKKFDIKRDPEFVLGSDSLTSLLNFAKEVEKGNCKLLLTCDCGCTILFFERIDETVYIEKYLHFNNKKRSGKSTGEILIPVEDFLRMLRELHIYIFNETKLEAEDGTQLS